MESVDPLRRVSATAVAWTVVLGALSGCGAESPSEATATSPASGETSQATTAGAHDGVLVITPVPDLPDSTRVDIVDGVSIAVPNSMTVETSPAEQGVVHLKIFVPGRDLPVGSVGVYRSPNLVDDAAVEGAIAVTIAGMSSSEMVDNLERKPVQWEGMPDGWAFTDVITREDGIPTEQLYVQLRDPAGTMLVSVWAEAPQGELDDSLQRQMLATLQVE